MKYLLTTFIALMLQSPVPGATDIGPAQRPNILIIYADDLGYGDVQCFNPKRGRIPTPHIDRLAAHGMMFTDAHASSGLCSPSRYTLLTGRYHWRTRLQKGIVSPWGPPLIASDRLTIAGLAKQHGYRTACIGKWHLGQDWPINRRKAGVFLQKPVDNQPPSPEQRALWNDVFSKPIANGPTTRGFDRYFGTDVPNWPPYCFIENDRTIGIPSHYLPSRLLKNHQASRQGPALEGWTLERILPAITDRAAEFITEQSDAENPFLLYLPLTSPHTPLAVNEPWLGKSSLNGYADFVMETDAAVGTILDALERHGAADDTLVIFTSDNGCAPNIGVDDLEQKGHFPSGPLRGYKGDVWEGGHRVPFIIRWPGTVAPGSTSGRLVHQADIMATLSDILGTTLPDSAGEDSYSLLPLLRGNDQVIRNHAVSCSGRGLPGLREANWKLIFGPGSGSQRRNQTEAKVDDSDRLQLYDLTNDPGETTNLATPQSQRVARMTAQLEQLITIGRSTPGTVQNNDVPVVRYPR